MTTNATLGFARVGLAMLSLAMLGLDVICTALPDGANATGTVADSPAMNTRAHRPILGSLMGNTRNH